MILLASVRSLLSPKFLTWSTPGLCIFLAVRYMWYPEGLDWKDLCIDCYSIKQRRQKSVLNFLARDEWPSFKIAISLPPATPHIFINSVRSSFSMTRVIIDLHLTFSLGPTPECPRSHSKLLLCIALQWRNARARNNMQASSVDAIALSENLKLWPTHRQWLSVPSPYS